jgi:hypothetical protein
VIAVWENRFRVTLRKFTGSLAGRTKLLFVADLHDTLKQGGPQPSFVIPDFETMSARWISMSEDDTRNLTLTGASLSGA